ncbi:putative transcriptional regulator with C-terminal CBS domains [Halalkaliarchaeum sp. AArc-CO]|uniref:CBS domain-containing protein n=1 Tax=Halalkaliarchaeum sp. AArc-CO TaxID=2866381 RepID=UPI00217D552E|nr:CBS domain-containing protein [Halalkaliarchaeum sp. AArc-CO]UWG51359.1 putative transcriptional regulator with C-terminal CBS domains [Halalkaliarchaeum sp. AArc-CO]
MRDEPTVRDVMHREFLGVSESDALGDAAELLVEENAEYLVVLRGHEPVGSLSARHVLDAVLADQSLETDVATVMEPPVPTVSAEQRLADVEERLLGEDAGHLIVTEEGEAIGVITERDLLAATTTVRGPTHLHEGTDPAVENSICEVCGSLSPELTSVNGQLVCPDCQDGL